MRAILKKTTETSTADSGTTAPALAFTAPRAELAKALKRLASVAERRSAMPMLQNVCIRVDGAGTTITATDLNVSLTITASAWIGDRGGIAVNAKAFADVVAKLPDGDVRIERDRTSTGIQVTSGGIACTLSGMADRDFPKVPDAPHAMDWASVAAGAFSEMFERVMFSLCKDETRFNLNGVLFESEGSGQVVRTVSTDGHRLTKYQRSLDGGLTLPSGVIVPAKGCAQIVKLLGAKAKGWCEIAVPNLDGKGRIVMFVRYQGATLAIKLIDMQFPPYEQVIPKDYDKLATVDRKALIAALDRAKLVCSETRGVKLSIGGGKLVLTSDHPDTGTATEIMKAEGLAAEGGKHFAVGINPKYLTELLKEIDDKLVTLAVGDELAPIVVRGTEHACSYPVIGAPFLGVIMPMRI